MSSFLADLARLHAAIALDALARVERGEAPAASLDPHNAHEHLGYFKSTVQTLAHDIETLLRELSECPQ